MITGNGLLANSFEPRFGQRSDVMIFAAGVSNSTQTDEAQFLRERNLLQATIAQYPDLASFVYFSSCGVTSSQMSPYMAHKRAMEELVSTHAAGLILRLPQVVGPSQNPNTLTNFLAHQILTDQPVAIWQRAQRNLIDVSDIVPMATHVINNRALFPDRVAIASARTMTMPELVAVFEGVLGKKARVRLDDKGEPLEIDTSHSLQIAAQLGMDLGHDYPSRVLQKYYGSLSYV